MKNPIKVTTQVNAPIDKVWEAWNAPEHIVKWNAASPEWHTTRASNDLREGGKIYSRMEAKDGSTGFDFTGTYERVKNNEQLAYSLTDGRKVSILFLPNGNTTIVEESFEAESVNSREMQRAGWQAILDNFKNYTESL